MAEKISQETLEKVRSKFVECRKEIVACSKPWPPWALVELLDIEDANEPVPSEVILYKALRRQPRMGIATKDEVVQVC